MFGNRRTSREARIHRNQAPGPRLQKAKRTTSNSVSHTSIFKKHHGKFFNDRVPLTRPANWRRSRATLPLGWRQGEEGKVDRLANWASHDAHMEHGQS